MGKLKQQKGSITLFVIVSMLFFVILLASMYMIASSKEQTGISETKRIKEIYEKDINQIDDVYETIGNGMKTKLIDEVQIGDYVAYDPTKGVENQEILSYTSEKGTGMSHGNGHGEQTFTATNQIKWRVFGKDENTGGVILISEEPIQTDAKEDFYLKGAIGYLYAEQELNEICKIYGYGEGADTSKIFKYETGDIVEGLDQETMVGSGARSIRIEDVNEITGFSPTEDGHYGVSYSHTIYSPTKKTTSGITATEVNTKDTTTTYGYQGVDYITDSESAIYQLLFRNAENSENIMYRMASRHVEASTYSKYVYVSVVGNGGVGSGSYIAHGRCDSHTFDEREDGMGIRPLIYLKSNLQTTGKDDSGAWMISE